MFLFDTIGIGLFTILGLQKTLTLGLSPHVAVLMGIVSAVFGGVMRDVLSNEIPLIFRKEIYATACLLGGFLFWLISDQFQDENIPMILTVLFIIVIRILHRLMDTGKSVPCSCDTQKNLLQCQTIKLRC